MGCCGREWGNKEWLFIAIMAIVIMIICGAAILMAIKS